MLRYIIYRLVSCPRANAYTQTHDGYDEIDLQGRQNLFCIDYYQQITLLSKNYFRLS